MNARPAAFGLGAVSLLAQVVLIREFASLFLGNELTTGLLLASWLLWVGLGSMAAARLPGTRFANTRALAALQAASGLLAFGSVTAVRLIPTLAGTAPGETLPVGTVLAAIGLLPAPLCLVFGLQFSLLAQLAGAGEGDRGPGTVYLLESMGSAAGGFLFTFLLAGRLPALTLTLLLAAAGTALGLAHLPIGGGRRILPGAAVFACLAAAVLLAAPTLERLTLDWRWPGFSVVASRETAQGTITVTRLGGQYNFYQNGLYSFALPDPQGAEEAVHLPMAVKGRARRVLVLGGGVAGILAEILKHPVSAVDYVELDPGLIDLARPFLPPADAAALDDPRVTVSYGDARTFVRRAPAASYDLVLMFLPEPENALVNRLYTLEFFREARRALTDDGLLSFGLAAAPNYLGEELRRRNGSMYRTLGLAFPSVAATPLERNIFFASPAPGGINLDPDRLRSNLAPLVSRLTYFKPEVAAARLPRDRTAEINETLRTADAPYNRDNRPVAHFLSLALQLDLLLGPGWLADRWREAGRWAWMAACLAAVVLLLPALFLPRSRARRWIAGATMASTGFAVMALEVVLLNAFQVSQGYLLRDLGALLALVMLGLAMGGLLTRSAEGPAGRRLLLGAEFGFLALATAGAWAFAHGLTGALTGGAGRGAFFLLAFLLGMMGGAEFPLLAADLRREGSAAGRGAGLAYGLDLLGSCLGAALVAALVIPLTGLAGAVLMVAGVKALSLALCLSQRRAKAGP